MIRLVPVLFALMLSVGNPANAQLGDPICDNVAYARIHGFHFGSDGAARTPIFSHYYACDLTTQVNIACWHPAKQEAIKELDGLWCTVLTVSSRDATEMVEDSLTIEAVGERQSVRMVEVASELVTAGYRPMGGGDFEQTRLVFAPGFTVSDLPSRFTYVGPGMNASLYFTVDSRSNLPGT